MKVPKRLLESAAEAGLNVRAATIYQTPKAMAAMAFGGLVGMALTARSGKSAEMPTRGGLVVTDDRVVLFKSSGALVARYEPAVEIERTAISSAVIGRSKITPTNLMLVLKVGEAELKFDALRGQMRPVAEALGAVDAKELERA